MAVYLKLPSLNLIGHALVMYWPLFQETSLLNQNTQKGLYLVMYVFGVPISCMPKIARTNVHVQYKPPLVKRLA